MSDNNITIIGTGIPHCACEPVFELLAGDGSSSRLDGFANWHDRLGEFLGIDLTRHLGSLQPTGASVALMPSTDTASRQQWLVDLRSVWLLDFWAEKLPEARFILVYRPVRDALARAIALGAEPAAFLATWRAACEEIVRFQQRHRRRSLLIEADAALRDPASLAEVCQQLSIELESPGSLVPDAQPGPFERLISDSLVREHAFLDALQMDLEGCATPLGHAVCPEPIDGASLWSAYALQMAKVAQLNDAAVATQRKVEQLAEELDRSRVEHQGTMARQLAEFEDVKRASAQLEERLSSKLQQLQQDLESARLDHKQAEAARQKVEAAKAEVAQESEMLLLQLHQVQEELESVFLDRQRAEEARKENDAIVTSLRSEVATWKQRVVEKEKLAADFQVKLAEANCAAEESARRSAELQARLAAAETNQASADALAKLESANRELAEENELLLLQLHQVQEELENYFLRCKSLEQQANPPAPFASAEAKAPAPAMPAAGAASAQQPDAKRPEKRASASISGWIRRWIRMRNQIRLLRDSGVFDAAWYLRSYPDVADAKFDPIEHYLKFGAAEGRNPSADFDTRRYLAAYPDVADFGMNPLVHYIKFGRAEGRSPMGSAWRG